MPNEKSNSDFVPHRGAINEKCPHCCAIPGAFCTKEASDSSMMLVHDVRVKRAAFNARALYRGIEHLFGSFIEMTDPWAP